MNSLAAKEDLAHKKVVRMRNYEKIIQMFMANAKKWLLVIVVALVLVGIAVLVEESLRVKPFQVKIQSLQDELSAKENELKAANDKIAESKARMEILVGIFVPAMKGQQMTETESVSFFLKWQEKVKSVGEDVLTDKFQAITTSGDPEKASADFLVYLLESINSTLEEK